MASGTGAGSAGGGSEPSTTGDGMLCDWMSGRMMFGDAMTGDAMTGDSTAGGGLRGTELTGIETAIEDMEAAVFAVGKAEESAAVADFAEEVSCACSVLDGAGAEAASAGRGATRTSG